MSYRFKLKKAFTTAQDEFFNEKPSWKLLASRIYQKFKICEDDLVIAFVHNGKEFTIKDDSGLQIFYLYNNSSDMTFVVQDSKSPDGASISLTWSQDSNLSDMSRSDDVLNILCWYLDGSKAPLTVDVGANKSVGGLRQAIRTADPESDPESLMLWKLDQPEPVDPEDSLADRMKARGDVATFATRLSHGNKLSMLFPFPPQEDHIHILMQHRSTGKRSRSPDIGREEVKKRRRDAGIDGEDRGLPSESALRKLYERLQGINDNPSYYSNPLNMMSFPFPFDYGRLPAERFRFEDLEELRFLYMGRTMFAKLWELYERLQLRAFTQIYIEGSMGYGKSHILAVLAGLLSRLGKRTVYLPDCRILLAAPIRYMKTALLCAFADPSSSEKRQTIRGLTSQEDIELFCGQQESMYFIVDQMNALDYEDTNRDPANNQQKAAVQAFIAGLTAANHFQITSASANHRTHVNSQARNRQQLKLSLMGGMTNDEMKQWWIHYKDKVPLFEDDDKTRLEDLTGRIPLLLSPLLDFANKPFREIEQEFWIHHNLIAVRENIEDFASEISDNDPRKYQQSYLPLLASCLAASPTSQYNKKWFDYRYFYPTNNLGNCTCGLARIAATIIIRRGGLPGLLCDNAWMQSLRHFQDNPSVVGFMVEQACLSTISMTGFKHLTVSWNPITATIFEDDLIQAIPTGDCELFFIPANPFFRDIDALYLKVDEKEKIVWVVPFQVTLAERHADSEGQFYSRWLSWTNRFPGYEVKSAFVWVVENQSSWTVLKEKLRITRSGSKLLSPEHTQIIMTVADINPTLGVHLASVRSLL